MVRVLMGHDDRVDLGVRSVLQQLRQGGVPEIEYDAETVVLDQEAGTRATRLGPRAAGAEDGE
ncbi:hypothetical protein GCM10029976_013090 [Kribbella albertanoniae]